LKIVGIRTVPYEYTLPRPIGDVHIPEGETWLADLAVFVDTDEGITGTTIGTPGAAEMIAALEGELVGRDPRAVRSLWERMVSIAFKAGNVGALKFALASIDCALWDVRAKAHGVPLWKELGGEQGEVRAYASGLDSPLDDEELATYYRRMAALGISAGKLKIGRDRDDDLRRLGVMAEALASAGGRPELMVDANEFWTPKQAVQRITELERSYELTWVEEPVPRHDARGLRRVSDAVRAPIATGENLDDAHDYVPLIANGAVDVVQISWTVSGITGALQVAELAHAFDLPVSMMNCPGRFMGHLAAALPHHVMMEVLDVGRDAVLTQQPELRDGMIVLGDQPGAGIDFDEERLAVHALGGSAPTPSMYRRADDAGKVG
jgi:L-alanine-DL-glutamate epimerase-like enolase superfamily enzyme